MPNTIVSLQYAGARGLHLYDVKNINGLGTGNVFAGDSLSDGAGNVGLTRLNNQYLLTLNPAGLAPGFNGLKVSSSAAKLSIVAPSRIYVPK